MSVARPPLNWAVRHLRPRDSGRVPLGWMRRFEAAGSEPAAEAPVVERSAERAHRHMEAVAENLGQSR